MVNTFVSNYDPCFIINNIIIYVTGVNSKQKFIKINNAENQYKTMWCKHGIAYPAAQVSCFFRLFQAEQFCHHAGMNVHLINM